MRSIASSRDSAAVGPQPDHPTAEPPALGHFSMDRGNALEDDPRAAFQLLARMHERFPPLSRLVFATAGRRRPPDQQTLDRAAARHAPSEQAGGKDAGVVDHDEVARAEQRRQLGDPGVRDGTGRAGQVKQPSTAPIGDRLLRDQISGQVVVEVADVHPRAGD